MATENVLMLIRDINLGKDFKFTCTCIYLGWIVKEVVIVIQKNPTQEYYTQFQGKKSVIRIRFNSEKHLANIFDKIKRIKYSYLENVVTHQGICVVTFQPSM